MPRDALGSNRAPPPPAAWLRYLAASWVTPFVVLVVGLVAVRAMPYALPSLPESVLEPVGRVLLLYTSVMLVSFQKLHFNAVPIFAVLSCLLIRRRWVIRRIEGRVVVAAWVHVVLWITLTWNQHFFDANRYLALVAWPTVPVAPVVASLVGQRERRARPGAVQGVVWGLYALLASLSAPSSADVFGVILWCGAGWWIHAVAARRTRAAECAALTFVALPLVQLMAATPDLTWLVVTALGVAALVALVRRTQERLGFWLVPIVPLALVLLTLFAHGLRRFWAHDGTRLGDGLAYSFCEDPERHRVYAALPYCGIGSTACQDAVIAEYDTRDFSRAVRHSVFHDPAFFGRLEQLVCLGETIEVGMCCVSEGSRYHDEGLIRFPASAPHDYEVGRKGQLLTRRAVYDAEHDAMFYVGAHVSRYDLETGRLDPAILGAVQGSSNRSLTTGAIFTAEQSAIHHGRNSLFLAEFLHGSRIYEVSLDTLEVLSTLDPHTGGAVALTVDEDHDRLYVAGLLGVDVYDLATRRWTARLRTGLLARTPTVDSRRNLIYVPATVEGRIHVFDRDTFERLGAIPIGIETRNALITGDGRWFLASETRAHYAWDAAELARRFRP